MHTTGAESRACTMDAADPKDTEAAKIITKIIVGEYFSVADR